MLFLHTSPHTFIQATSNKQQATSMATSMSFRDLYPDAKKPTRPRFQIGDIVYTHGIADLPGYSFGLHNTKYIHEIMQRHGYTEDQVIIKPAIFGIIVDEPDYGDTVFDCTTGNSRWGNRVYQGHEWLGSDDPYMECDVDLPDSGSVWFLPDNERRYFVKWINKETFPRSNPREHFQPMRDEKGSPVFNLALMPEDYLYKAPNFIEILRAKVRRRNEVEKVLNDHLQLDECSTKGITSIVCGY